MKFELPTNDKGVSEDVPALMDVLWKLSGLVKSQTYSPAIAHSRFETIRDRLNDVAGELQALQADISVASSVAH